MGKDSLKNIRKNLFKRVEKYELDEEILNKIFDIVSLSDYDEESISKNFTIELEKYLVEQISNGDIDLQIKLLQANSFLKVIFQKNPKYKLEDKNINRLYEEAVELAIENYDGSDSLSIIILKYMKKLSHNYISDIKKDTTIKSSQDSNEKTSKKLENELKKDSISNKIKDQEKQKNDSEQDNSKKSKIELPKKDLSGTIEDKEELYDLSFFKEYILLFKINKIDFAKLIKCGYLKLDEVLEGKILVKESLMWELYSEFNVNSYEELKNIIETKVQLKKMRDKYKTYMPPVEGNYKGYNIDILNEYFKYSEKNEKQKMAESMGINIQSLYIYLRKKIINSKNMKKIFIYFNVENYNQFIEVVLQKISQFKKEKDLSFLNEYYSLSKDDYEPLANKLGITKSTFKTYIKTDSSTLRKYLKPICEYFQVQNYDELRSLIERKIRELKLNQENIFDIDGNELIHDYYIALNEDERKELANILEITPATLKTYIYNLKTKPLPKILLKKLLEYYNVEKLSDLKKIFGEKINSQNNTEENIYDIDGKELIHDYYIALSEDERKELANILEITPATLKKNIYLKIKPLPKILLKKLLEYYKVEKLSELKEIFGEKINSKNNAKKYIHDVDGNELIHDYYITLNEDERKELANILEITPATLKNYMANYKTKSLSEKLLMKLLEYYKVEKLSELKEIFGGKINSGSSLKNEETIKSKDSNLKKIHTKGEKHTDIASKVDRNLMFSIMNVNTLNREDYTIVTLLFGGFKGRYYSVESISNFLGIEKEYVLEIYNKCLSEYRNTIVNLLSFRDDEMLLKLESSEDKN